MGEPKLAEVEKEVVRGEDLLDGGNRKNAVSRTKWRERLPLLCPFYALLVSHC